MTYGVLMVTAEMSGTTERDDGGDGSEVFHSSERKSSKSPRERMGYFDRYFICFEQRRMIQIHCVRDRDRDCSTRYPAVLRVLRYARPFFEFLVSVYLAEVPQSVVGVSGGV